MGMEARRELSYYKLLVNHPKSCVRAPKREESRPYLDPVVHRGGGALLLLLRTGLGHRRHAGGLALSGSAPSSLTRELLRNIRSLRSCTGLLCLGLCGLGHVRLRCRCTVVASCLLRRLLCLRRSLRARVGRSEPSHLHAGERVRRCTCANTESNKVQK